MMGITKADDPFYITDFYIPKQEVSSVTTEFDDNSFAEILDIYCGPPHNLQPYNIHRIWVHSHPAGVANPSATDEETFKTGFGAANWAVMVILPKKGELYARMRVNLGNCNLEFHLDYEIDYTQGFPSADPDLWKKEVEERCTEKVLLYASSLYGEPYKSARGKSRRKNKHFDPITLGSEDYQSELANTAWEGIFSEPPNTIHEPIPEDYIPNIQGISQDSDIPLLSPYLINEMKKYNIIHEGAKVEGQRRHTNEDVFLIKTLTSNEYMDFESAYEDYTARVVERHKMEQAMFPIVSKRSNGTVVETDIGVEFATEEVYFPSRMKKVYLTATESDFYESVLSGDFTWDEASMHLETI